VDNQAFRRAVKELRRAGYGGDDIGVYLMVGLPEQRGKKLKGALLS